MFPCFVGTLAGLQFQGGRQTRHGIAELKATSQKCEFEVKYDSVMMLICISRLKNYDSINICSILAIWCSHSGIKNIFVNGK